MLVDCDDIPPLEDDISNSNSKEEPEGAFPSFDNESPIARHRRHAGYEGKGDGAADYQNGAMHPLDWSNKGDSSVGESTLSSHREAKQARTFIFAQHDEPISSAGRNAASASGPSHDFVLSYIEYVDLIGSNQYFQ